MVRGAGLMLMLVGCTAEPRPADRSTPGPVMARVGLPGPRSSVCRDLVVARNSACALHWTEECDELLLAAAFRGSEAPARTGACYYHDRSTCPDCACGYYLKVDGLGYDGGTGCLASRAALVEQLRNACADRRCEP